MMRAAATSFLIGTLFLSSFAEACHRRGHGGHHRGHGCGGMHSGPPPHQQCSIPTNIYRSSPFTFSDESHVLSVVMIKGRPTVHLTALRDIADITDDREFYAVPKRPFPPHHKHRKGIHAEGQFSCKANKATFAVDIQAPCERPPRPTPACKDNRLSFQWGGGDGESVPSLFKGQIAMDLIGNTLVGYTALVTDRATSVPLQLTLTPVFTNQ